MRIENLKLTNFKTFKKVELRGLEPYTVFVGANGTGKSTLFDIFGFLRDCLKDNVGAALGSRGGFNEVISRSADERAIGIELKIRMKLDVGERVVTYELKLEERDGQPVVTREILRYTRFGGGQPYRFLNFENGQGEAITNEAEVTKDPASIKRDHQKLSEPDTLAIKGLGQFERFEAARAFRSLIENWHVSDFHIQSARSSPKQAYAEHLSPEGENLPLVAQFLYRRHRQVFDRILGTMKSRVPGVAEVEATETVDGRVVLRFKDGAFKDPFAPQSVSDGTIKMFAYLVLLHDPRPHPLLCVEEPENQLYPSLLPELSEEFEEYAARGGQVFVSTHSPDFLNQVPIEAIFMLSKQQGFTVVKRASENPNIKAMIAAGDKPGWLWRQRLFEGIDP